MNRKSLPYRQRIVGKLVIAVILGWKPQPGRLADFRLQVSG
ncbi:MAG: hypothetical protein ACYC9J_11500 [Sulfuricaulis sp.]